jgi:hypothetical protein
MKSDWIRYQHSLYARRVSAQVCGLCYDGRWDNGMLIILTSTLMDKPGLFSTQRRCISRTEH